MIIWEVISINSHQSICSFCVGKVTEVSWLVRNAFINVGEVAKFYHFNDLIHTFQDTISKFYHYCLSIFFPHHLQSPPSPSTCTYAWTYTIFAYHMMGEMNNHINEQWVIVTFVLNLNWNYWVLNFPLIIPSAITCWINYDFLVRSCQYKAKQEGRNTDEEFSNTSFVKELVGVEEKDSSMITAVDPSSKN